VWACHAHGRGGRNGPPDACIVAVIVEASVRARLGRQHVRNVPCFPEAQGGSGDSGFKIESLLQANMGFVCVRDSLHL
jgi:hypothetical protein